MIDLHIFFRSVVLDSSHRTDLALHLFCRLNCNSSPANKCQKTFSFPFRPISTCAISTQVMMPKSTLMILNFACVWRLPRQKNSNASSQRTLDYFGNTPFKSTQRSLNLRRLMSYIYMEHPFLMFLDHTQRRSTVGRTPLDE